MAIGNYDLQKAKNAKNDEFYTQLRDIENELAHYKKHFEGKTVFCNCDDPYESNFFRFFVLNFDYLKLKELVCTSFAASTLAGTVYPMKVPYVSRVKSIRDMTGDQTFGPEDVEHIFEIEGNSIEPLDGDGDFRSRECIELLDECDIVCTNPPFSLFREYMAQLIEHRKDFLIIGSINAVKYREIFPLLKDNQIWSGYKPFGGGMDMIVPEDVFDDSKVKKYKINERGEMIVNVMGVCWFTNLDIQKRHEDIPLFRHYDPDTYPNYVNFNGIDVKKVNDIPCDYAGYMGVPISFMDKYNPEQFELVGLGTGKMGASLGVTRNYRGRTDLELHVNGVSRCPYERIVIKNKHPEV